MNTTKIGIIVVAIMAGISMVTAAVGGLSTPVAKAEKCTTLFPAPNSGGGIAIICAKQGKTPSQTTTVCDASGTNCQTLPTTHDTHKNTAQSAVNEEQFCKQVFAKQNPGTSCTTGNGK